MYRTHHIAWALKQSRVRNAGLVRGLDIPRPRARPFGVIPPPLGHGRLPDVSIARASVSPLPQRCVHRRRHGVHGFRVKVNVRVRFSVRVSVKVSVTVEVRVRVRF